MEIASCSNRNVTAKLNVLISLMKTRNSAASEISHSITNRDAVATQPQNGHARMDNALATSKTAMVSPNVPTNLMKVTSAASRNSHSMMERDAVVKRTNGNVPMDSASIRNKCAMAKPNVLINLMKVSPDAVSRTTSSTVLRDVAATSNLSGPVLMAHVSPKLSFVMVKPSAKITLMS
jgi:hypothetical protein